MATNSYAVVQILLIRWDKIFAHSCHWPKMQIVQEKIGMAWFVCMNVRSSSRNLCLGRPDQNLHLVTIIFNRMRMCWNTCKILVVYKYTSFILSNFESSCPPGRNTTGMLAQTSWQWRGGSSIEPHRTCLIFFTCWGIKFQFHLSFQSKKLKNNGCCLDRKK